MKNKRRLRILIIIISFTCFYGFGVAYNNGDYYTSIALIIAAIILLLVNRRFYK